MAILTSMIASLQPLQSMPVSRRRDPEEEEGEDEEEEEESGTDEERQRGWNRPQSTSSGHSAVTSHTTRTTGWPPTKHNSLVSLQSSHNASLSAPYVIII